MLIIGNYYSLKAEHEKAVLLPPRSQAQPPLPLGVDFMGHEYVELKNTAAAVDAYRHAVDINPKDYRAWYGLGQTYEILQMYFYALSTTARPPRSGRTTRGCGARWRGATSCSSKPTIKCYQRAEANHDREGIAYTELAKLYRRG